MVVNLVAIFLTIFILHFLPLGFDTIFYPSSENRVYDRLHVLQWFYSTAMGPPEHGAHDTIRWASLLRMVAALLQPGKSPFHCRLFYVFPNTAVFFTCGS